MSRFLTDSQLKRGLLVLSAGLFVYILFRALSVPLVHDEVATYVHYVQVGEFIPGLSMVDANNHLLNSALSIGSDRLLGTSPFALRLASLLSFFILIVYLLRFRAIFKSPWLYAGFVIALLGNHYMMEFYALSRGYGMSMSFMMAALYHSWSFLSGANRRDAYLLVLWTFLGLASNLSLLFVFIMLTVLVGLDILSSRSLKRYLIPAGLQALILAGAMLESMWLKACGALYYGQGTGFWSVTMETLSLHLAGEDRIFPFVFLIAFMFCMGIWLVKSGATKQLIKRTWLFHTVLAGSLLGIFASHFIMGANYPMDRVGLYLYPLLIGAFVMSLDVIALRRPSAAYGALLLVYFPIHFLLNANFDHADFWYMERVPMSFYDELEAFEKEQGHMASLSGYHTTRLSYWMRAELEDRQVPPMNYVDYPLRSADYIVSRGGDEDMGLENYKQVLIDEPSGNGLWKRQTLAHRVLVDSLGGSLETLDAPFFELMLKDIPDTMDYLISFDVAYHSTATPAKVHLVLEKLNSAAEQYGYQPIPLVWRQKADSVSLHGTMLAKTSGTVGDHFKLYLWNKDSDELREVNYRARLYRLETQEN